MSEGKTTSPTGHPAGIPVLLPDPEQPYGNAWAEPSQTLKIKVMDKYENTIYCKIRRSTKLEKVMDAFCHSRGIPHKSVQFLFDGSRVQPTDSPHTLGMEDGDILEAHESLPAPAPLETAMHDQTELADTFDFFDQHEPVRFPGAPDVDSWISWPAEEYDTYQQRLAGFLVDHNVTQPKKRQYYIRDLDSDGVRWDDRRGSCQDATPTNKRSPHSTEQLGQHEA